MEYLCCYCCRRPSPSPPVDAGPHVQQAFHAIWQPVFQLFLKGFTRETFEIFHLIIDF